MKKKQQHSRKVKNKEKGKRERNEEIILTEIKQRGKTSFLLYFLSYSV